MKSCSPTMVQVVWLGKFRVDYSWLRVHCLKFRMHRVCGLWVGYKDLEISVILYFVALLLRIPIVILCLLTDSDWEASSISIPARSLRTSLPPCESLPASPLCHLGI